MYKYSDKKKGINKRIAGVGLAVASILYMTGCSGKGGGGGDGASSCSTPIEASLSLGSYRIGGATTSVELVTINDINYTFYNVANELRVSTVADPDLETAALNGKEVEGYIHDIEIVKYGDNNNTYALLAMGDEGIIAVNVSKPLDMLVGSRVMVSHEYSDIYADGSGTITDFNVTSSRAFISSLAVYEDQLIIGDEGYGLHKIGLNKLIDAVEGTNFTMADMNSTYTLQYAGENPWGGPKSLTLYGEGNSTRLFVAQGFMGMGIYKPDTLDHVGHYNLYTDATEANNGEDYFYDMNISAIASTDICTGMPDYIQAASEINGTTTETPWADFEFYGKYYYDARSVDVAKVGSNTYAYIAYGLAGLIAVDVSDYNTTSAECGNTGTYLGYVPAIPIKGPEDRLIGNQDGGNLFSRAGSGMLKDAGVVDVKVDLKENPTKVFYTDHFGGLMVIDDASTPYAPAWHGPDAGDYPNDTNTSVPHVPSYDFVKSYDMSPSVSDDEESLPNFTLFSPILLATGEVGGHGNSLVLTGSGFDSYEPESADVVMAAGAGGLNFIELYVDDQLPTYYDFNVTEYFPTTMETGAAPIGSVAPEISVGHSAGVGAYDNILYLADGPHGMMAWKVAELSGGSCVNIATEAVGLVGNTLQSESNITDANGTVIYPTPHADEVVVISDGVTKSAMVASLSAGLRRVNVNVLGTEGAPELLYPTAGDIFEHSSGDTEEKLAGIEFEDRVYDVEVRGNIAYTADGLAGVTVYDLDQIPDGSNDAIVVANIKQDGNNRINNATGIALSADGNYAFVAGGSTGIAVIKITHISESDLSLSIIKSFQPIKWEDVDENPKAHNADGVAVDVKVMDGIAFFTYDSFGVLAYRIEDLINENYDNPITKFYDDDADDRPNAVGYFKLQNDAGFVDWSGGAAGIDAISTTDGKKLFYIAYGNAGVIKLDWSNLWPSQEPTSIDDTKSPSFVDHINTAGSATDVVVWNGRVYVADGAGGLVLVK